MPKIFEELPEINNNNYNTWSKQLSQAWGTITIIENTIMTNL